MVKAYVKKDVKGDKKKSNKTKYMKQGKGLFETIKNQEQWVQVAIIIVAVILLIAFISALIKLMPYIIIAVIIYLIIKYKGKKK